MVPTLQVRLLILVRQGLWGERSLVLHEGRYVTLRVENRTKQNLPLSYKEMERLYLKMIKHLFSHFEVKELRAYFNFNFSGL